MKRENEKCQSRRHFLSFLCLGTVMLLTTTVKSFVATMSFLLSGNSVEHYEPAMFG
ncbi:MAG: twin-arginine translocation signal domain-containing protein [Deltaproteobacteria bacterium]|nr:twin-arginine translocation signal domain-containing protein [Deltaproteobacteria bacterium]